MKISRLILASVIQVLLTHADATTLSIPSHCAVYMVSAAPLASEEGATRAVAALAEFRIDLEESKSPTRTSRRWSRSFLTSTDRERSLKTLAEIENRAGKPVGFVVNGQHAVADLVRRQIHLGNQFRSGFDSAYRKLRRGWKTPLGTIGAVTLGVSAIEREPFAAWALGLALLAPGLDSYARNRGVALVDRLRFGDPGPVFKQNLWNGEDESWVHMHLEGRVNPHALDRDSHPEKRAHYLGGEQVHLNEWVEDDHEAAKGVRIDLVLRRLADGGEPQMIFLGNVEK